VELPGAGVVVEVNQETPPPVVGVSAYDTPLDSGGSITVQWVLSADDGGGANDVVGYTLERSDAGAGVFTPVVSVGAGVSSVADTTTVNGIQYDYRVVTEDLGGNRSVSATYGPVISINNDGSDVTAPEEVTGLSAIPGDGIVFLSWTGSADTALDLVDQLLDISLDGGATYGTNAPAYNDGTSLSLGKDADFRLVQGLANGVAHTFRIRVTDSSGNESAGVTVSSTPDPTAVTAVSGTISADTTWAAGVFHVTGTVTVSSGVTLTIDPGVVVKFNPSQALVVNGALWAVGTDLQPVVFTSFTDDAYGGDSNGDGVSSGTPGYWNSLQFYDSVDDAATRLEHAIVRYGGTGGVGNVYLNRADFPIVSNEITDSSNYGLFLDFSSSTVSGNLIADNGSHGLFLRRSGYSPAVQGNEIRDNGNHGIYSEGPTPALESNTITGNAGFGILFSGGQNAPEILGNTVTGNGTSVRIPFSAIPDISSGNVLTGNARDVVELWGNSLTRSVEPDPALVYSLLSGTATVATGVSMRLQPGTVWKSQSASLTVNGALTAEGTALDPIVFTSYRDDSVGGDTNGDGVSSGQPGDWDAIRFNDTVLDFLTTLEHVHVRYGGSGSVGNVYLLRADFPIVSSEITDSSNYGVLTDYSSSLFSGNLIRDNGVDGLLLRRSGYSPTVQNNEIRDNGRYGVYASLSAVPLIDGNTSFACVGGAERIGRQHLGAERVERAGAVREHAQRGRAVGGSGPGCGSGAFVHVPHGGGWRLDGAFGVDVDDRSRRGDEVRHDAHGDHGQRRHADRAGHGYGSDHVHVCAGRRPRRRRESGRLGDGTRERQLARFVFQRWRGRRERSGSRACVVRRSERRRERVFVEHGFDDIERGDCEFEHVWCLRGQCDRRRDVDGDRGQHAGRDPVAVKRHGERGWWASIRQLRRRDPVVEQRPVDVVGR
jgi:parallel beta-helix repeat protein